MDLYVTETSEVYMPSSHLRGKERGQQVQSICLFRIFTEVCKWAIMCVVTWPDCTSREWGYLHNPLTRSCMMRAFWPMWDWRGEASNDEHGRYILYVGNDRVQCFDSTWWEGDKGSPPPIDWVVHACYHLQSTQESIFNHNFEIKHILKLFSMVTSSDFCLCAQLAMSISP
jgi:hypothetical protein